MKIIPLLKKLSLLSLLLMINAHLQASIELLELEVTTTNSVGAGSLAEKLSQAKTANSDVMITFNLSGGGIIESTNGYKLKNDHNHRIVLDGELPSGGKVELKKTGGAAHTIGLTVQSNQITIRNMKIVGFGDQIRIIPQIENTIIEKNTFINAESIGVHILGKNTQIRNENQFLNTGDKGQGILIAGVTTGTKIGEITSNYTEYNYFSGFKTGITVNSDTEVSSCIFGGNNPSITDCAVSNTLGNTTGISIQNVIGKTVQIGQSSNKYSNVFSNTTTSHIDINKSENISIDNNSIGIDPRWCEDYKPTNQAKYGIKVNESENIRIGKENKNIIGTVKEGINTTLANQISIYNNVFGIDESEKTYTVGKGLLLRGDTHFVKNNSIASYTSTALELRTSRGSQINNNTIGLSNKTPKTYEIGNGIGMEFLNVSNLQVEQNYIYSKTTSISMTRSTTVDLINNYLGSTINGEPITESAPKAIDLSADNNKIRIQGNRIMGNYTDGIYLFDPSTTSTPKTDREGNTYVRSNVKIHGNYFHQIENHAIYVGRSYEAEIGSASIENSGNTIMRANYGIRSLVHVGMGSLIKAHRNYIGISKEGVPGEIKTSGIFLAIYPVGDSGHEIGKAEASSGNIITNCLSRGLDIRSVEQIEISGNAVYGNGADVFYNPITNRILSEAIRSPIIDEIEESGNSLIIKGRSNYNGLIELYRKTATHSGAYEYVGSVNSKSNKTWTYSDQLLNQIHFQGYIVTETNEEKKTSNFSNVKLNPFDEEGKILPTATIINPSGNYASLSQDPNQAPFLLDDEYVYFIDKSFKKKGNKIMLYNYLREKMPIKIIEIHKDKYSFYVGNLPTSTIHELYSLEITSENGNTRSLRFIPLGE